MPGNARRGRPQGQCHRKYTAKPAGETRWAARVKWCGKSAPRCRQRRRHGKPHREQDQVGAAWCSGARRSALAAPGEPSRCRPGRSHEALGDGRPRGMAATADGSHWRSFGGTEPGLHAVWHALHRRKSPAAPSDPAVAPPATVDALAEETGIIADSRGRPCELRGCVIAPRARSGSV